MRPYTCNIDYHTIINSISMNLFVLFFVFSTISFSCLTINISSTDEIHRGSNIDLVSLLAFKSEITHDPLGVLNNWNVSVPICHWQGVTCGTKHRRVVAVELVHKGLVGTLSPFVGNISFLHVLELPNNSFHGGIPPQLGHLLQLKSLVLHYNSFTGEVPANISRCLKLQHLSLAYNHFSGTVPPKLALLSKLKFLTLSYNKFVGTLLDIVVNMTSLQRLSTTNNYFEGSIPHSIGRCKNLTYLLLGGNKISGTFPPSFYNLSSLQLIELFDNQLVGSLPSDFGYHFPQLQYLGLSSNYFHGNIPISMSNLTQLTEVGVYSNNFTGKFLFNARNIPNLNTIDISLNHLGIGGDGDLDFLYTLVNCTLLENLWIGGNNLGGTLPAILGNLSTEITIIEADLNQFTGTIPSEIFNLPNLEKLTLHDNQLTGNLPHEIGNLKKLELFRCDINHLTGSIPSSIGTLQRLSHLSLENNNFKGTIPSTLGDCKNLLYLYLSQNKLTGLLPPHLLQATMLVSIHFEENQMHGTIPEQINQLKNLVTLNLSRNAFTGEVPSSLGSCVELLQLDMGGNKFTGSIPQSFKLLSSIQYLNLSHNNFSGQIPNFLANFPLVVLDLSFNNLEGEVPTIGVFENLSAISLSANSKLCGGKHELNLPRCSANNLATQPKRFSSIMIVIISISCLVGSISIIVVVYLVLRKRKKNNVSNGSSMTDPLPKVSYGMLHKATNGFSEANLLGIGHFGCVYKGILEPENVIVAIKVMRLQQHGASKSFTAECKTLTNVRHRNLVKILTACSSTDYERNDFKALIYEFMLNGNLEQWIHLDQQQSLRLQQRLDIAIDMANALDYLHNGCGNPIIHCDLKPSNILLDEEMVAHVGDFGIARFHSNAGTSNSSSVFVKGTVGYVAPEYGLGSVASKEGDIYSYGIVLIEMMSAIKPTDSMFEGNLNLHQHAKLALTDELGTIIDPRLVGNGASKSHGHHQETSAENGRKIGCIKSIIELGVKCSVESPQDRMTMVDIVRELQSIKDIFKTTQDRGHYAAQS